MNKHLSSPQPTAPNPEGPPQDTLFGMPAVTALPSNPQFSSVDLADKNILWTKVMSAGLSLPLPLDTCCSVSIVSEKQADRVATHHPHLRFTKLEQHVPVSVAGPNSKLWAVGIMQVPIVWENGRSVTFTMLVVPNLTWPILFGQNHLRKTDARIYSRDLKVHFADPTMGFEVSCHNSNPMSVFNEMKRQISAQASVANVTCLLTAMPRPLGLSNPVSLCRGLNVVTVCLVVAASLLGSPFFAGSHWLDGTQFSPGLQTLSGPIDLSVRAQALNPGEFPPFPTGFPTSHPPDSPPCPNQPSDSEFSCSGNLASHQRSDRVNHD